jgi:hypothetical protein
LRIFLSQQRLFFSILNHRIFQNSHYFFLIFHFYFIDYCLRVISFNRSGSHFFPDIKMEFKTDFRSGDWAATEWTMTGTNKGNIAPIGNLPEVPATNKRMSFKGATIGQWRNNKIIRETDYYNPITMMQQLGLMPSMPTK